MIHLQRIVAATIVFGGVVFASQSSVRGATTGSGHLLAGCWSGSWHSCTNGHNGRLSATFCRIDASRVQARFRGTFHKIIPFRYNATLQIVHEEPGMMVLSGSQRLGPLMGTFQYQATITEGRFHATYSSRRDSGNWNMTR